jgi:cytochrome P450
MPSPPSKGAELNPREAGSEGRDTLARMIYDPYAREFQHDPYPHYRWFRDEEPCTYNPRMDFWALFRFQDVWDATLDWKTYSSSLGPSLENRGQVPGDLFSIIGMDPPRHTRLRNIVSRGFTPKRIAALEPAARRIAARYLDPLRDEKRFDLQQVFSVKLPMDVISELVGIPEEMRDDYRQWVDGMLERDPDTLELPQHGIQGAIRAREMLAALLAERRARPRDDLMSLIAAAEYDEPDGRRRKLDDEEVLGFCSLLAAAGAETTAKLIGNLVVLLHRHRDQRAYLWQDPARIPNAIEEALRYDAPSQFQGRVATRDVEIHGKKIPAGARVALVTGAACRDERRYPEPDRFDVTRQPDAELYFGYGQHVCIGKSLARLEARVAFEEIRARFPDYEVEEAGLTRTFQAHVRGFKNVPVSIG